MVDDPLAFQAEDQLAVVRLGDEVGRAERPQELDERGPVHVPERTVRAQELVGRDRVDAAALRDGGEDLLDQRGQVQIAGLGRLVPVMRRQEEPDHRDGLDELGPQRGQRRGLGVLLVLAHVDTEDGGRVVRPSRAAQALAEGGDLGRDPHLGHGVDVADVDAELQGRRADQRGRSPWVLQPGLGFLAQLLGETPVVGHELVRDPLARAHAAQQVGELLHLRASVGEHEVVLATQDAEQLLAERDDVAGREILGVGLGIGGGRPFRAQGGLHTNQPPHDELQLAAVPLGHDADHGVAVAWPENLARAVEVAQGRRQRDARGPPADGRLQTTQQCLMNASRASSGTR